MLVCLVFALLLCTPLAGRDLLPVQLSEHSDTLLDYLPPGLRSWVAPRDSLGLAAVLAALRAGDTGDSAAVWAHTHAPWYRQLRSDRWVLWSAMVVENTSGRPFPLLVTQMGDSDIFMRGHDSTWQVLRVSSVPVRDSLGIILFPFAHRRILLLPPQYRDTIVVRTSGYKGAPTSLPHLSHAVRWAMSREVQLALRRVFIAIVLGAMFILLLYCTINYVQTREPLLMWYACFCGVIALLLWRHLEQAFPTIGLGGAWLPWIYTKVFFHAGITVSYYHFIYHFLPVRPRYLGRAVRAIDVICLLTVLLEVVLLWQGWQSLSFAMYQCFRIVLLVPGLVLMVMLWHIGNRLAQIVLMGAGLLMLGEGLSLIDGAGPLGDAATAGVLGDTVFFTLAIAYRNRHLRTENARMKAEQEQQAERIRIQIAHDVHDEVGSQLTQLTLKAKVVGKQVPPALAAQFADIARTARTISDTLRSSSSTIDPSYDLPENFLPYLRESIRQLLQHMTIEAHLRFPETESSERIAPYVRQQLIFMLKEIIHNAIRHSQARTLHVEVAIHAATQVLALDISDDGVGLPPAPMPAGRGLRSLHERAGRIGARLAITSNPGQGVHIRLQVPLAAHYPAGR
ncbi:MAG: hypothetical protein OHK0039_41820 [Bacteroidia bacterium]